MKRQIGAILLLLFTTAAFALVSAYSIAPVKSSWSGMADPDPGEGGVSGRNGDIILNSSCTWYAQHRTATMQAGGKLGTLPMLFCCHSDRSV
jgi:hypothetical protein